MQSLGKYIRNRKDIQMRLNDCECEQYVNVPLNITWQRQLGLHVEDLVENTCCPKVSHTHQHGQSPLPNEDHDVRAQGPARPNNKY